MDEVKDKAKDSAQSETSNSSSASEDVKSSANQEVSSSADNNSSKPSNGVYVAEKQTVANNYQPAVYDSVTAPSCGRDSYISDSYFSYVDRVILKIVLKKDEQYTKDEVLQKIKQFKGGL